MAGILRRRTRQGACAARLAFWFAGMLAAVLALTPAARAGGLVRDPDIEHALAELARPVLTAAGLNAGRIQILVIADSKFNAFVAAPDVIAVHSGLILKLDRAAELQSVLAHEAAHIANGHITRRLANIRAARGAAALGMLLSAAVAATTGSAEAAGGVAIGSQSTAMRLLFSHTRAEEASADQSALRYMISKGIDPTAMVDVLEIFRGQELLSVGRQDPYVRTHPLTRDRIRAVEGYAVAYKSRGTAHPEADYWFARAKGKLGAFLKNPGYTLRRVPRGDTSDIALMRRAIAYHRIPDAAKAIAEIDRLAAMRPGDPFVHELRGQILLESRQTGAAVAAYGRAVNLAPRNALILAGYGRALVAQGGAQATAKALQVLERARTRDPRDPRMLRDLAVAYARSGNGGMASLVTAERYALLGQLETAATHARRAEGLLPRGSRGWTRAQDVLDAARTAARRR